MTPLPRSVSAFGLLLLAALALAVPTARAETIPLDGVVADEDGKPLAGAVVELKPVLAEFAVARLLLSGKDDVPAVATAKCGADGHYVLEAPAPGMWIVLASAPGRIALQRTLTPLLEGMSLGEARLPPQVEVKVRVLDADGNAMPGAQVQAAVRAPEDWYRGSDEDDFAWRLPGMRSLTGPDGRLTLHRTPETRIDLLAAASGWVSVKAVQLDAATVELKLERGCPRAVLAVDPAGKPVAGVVLAAGDAPVATTDAAGGATIAAPCGRKAALRWATADGRQGTEPLTPLPPAPPDAAPPPPLRIAVPARPTLLAGRVLERGSRRPIAGAYVWEAGDAGAAVRSDTKGGYGLPLPEPGSNLAAAAAGSGRTWERLNVSRRKGTSPAGPVAGPTLLLQATALVRGTALDEAGAPVAGAKVAVQWSEQEDWSSSPWSTPAQRTGADGAFRLRIAAGERFSLRASHPQRADAEEEQAPLRAGEQRARLRLVLLPARGAFGRIVDLAERPVAGAEVSLSTSVGLEDQGWEELRGAAESALQATSDAEGRFRFDKLPPPPLDLEVRRPGFAPLRIQGIEPPQAAVAASGAGGEGKAKPRTPPADLGTVVLHPGLNLRGQVVDKAGKPVAGVAIRCFPESLERGGRWLSQAMGDGPEVASGPDGAFAVADLPEGRKAEIFAHKEGYEAAHLAGLDPASGEPVKVVLEPTFALRGTVSDEDGRPVADALVGLAGSTPGFMHRGAVMGRRYVSRATTDDDGRFSLPLSEGGKLRLDAEAAGFLPNGVEVEVAEKRDVEGVEIVLHPGAALAGRIVGPDGAPLDHVQVWLGGSEEHYALGRRQRGTVSNGDGEYRLEGLDEGKESVTAQRSGYSTLEKEVEVQGGETRLDLRLERSAAFEGRVLDPEGQPVGRARVVAEGGDGSSRATSRSDGTFTLSNLEPGSYQVWADHPSYGSSERVEATLGGAATRSLELRLRDGSVLHGRVLGLAFEQLPDVAVSAMMQGEKSVSYKEGSVDFQGQYRLAGLEPGEWHVSARFGSRSAEGQATVPAGGEAVLDLEFRTGLTLSGRITRDGEPFEGASLLAQPQGGGTSSGFGQTDSRGAFRIEGLEAGTYILNVVAFNSALRHQEEVEVPAPGEVLIDLPSSTLSGRVVESPGRSPVAGAVLSLRREPGEAKMDRFLPPVGLEGDRDGTFSFRGLTAGRYLLTASKEGYSRAETWVEIGAGGDVAGVELEVERTGRQALRIVAGAGTGLPREVAIVLVEPASGRVVTQTQARLDEGGRAEIDALPGSWEVVVAADGFATSAQPLAIPGPVATVVLAPPTLLSVRVPDLAGVALGGLLEVQDRSGRPFRTLSFQGSLDSRFPLFQGTASVQNLPAGSWQLKVTAPDGRTFQGSAVTQVGRPAEVELGAAGRAAPSSPSPHP